ncbi:MAG: isocitrate lyase/phosphoenolpyruvate mutase family protein [Chitinophagaceae bacterium]|nr:isocitrate lyase/phosphoenolpyruvate mutase family protein [Chitinophagaceae bacterium]
MNRHEIFRSLHQSPGIFVVPNPWDAGSAKLLTHFGYKALATTSAGLAHMLGKPDGQGVVTREETLQNAKSIVDATHLPVSADLEKGFGHDPESCAATITMAASVGLSGGSIEDSTGNRADPIYPFDLAVARVKAAVAAARSLAQPFTLTARAENLINGRPDLKDTINRLVAFADAGADVLFAPGLKTKEEIETVVKAVAPGPVNVVMGLSGGSFTLKMLEDLGVKRVSLGSSLSRAAFTAFIAAAKEVLNEGTFNYAVNAVPYAELNGIFGKG